MWGSLAIARSTRRRTATREPRPSRIVAALTASAASPEDDAPLVGWYASRHLLGLRASVADLYTQHKSAFESLLARPGHVGWRAVAELEDWRAVEVYDKALLTGAAYDAEVTRRMGCGRAVRMAGPFGHGSSADRLVHFPAEHAAPWPAAWAPDEKRGSVARVLPVTQNRCLAVADEQVQDGVFYAETFFTTHGERDLLVAVQGALEVWVDDVPVLARDVADWGSWQRFGAHIAVADGRHRVLAKLMTPAASVRLLQPDGTGAGIDSDADAGAPLRVGRAAARPRRPESDRRDRPGRGRGGKAGSAASPVAPCSRRTRPTSNRWTTSRLRSSSRSSCRATRRDSRCRWRRSSPRATSGGPTTPEACGRGRSASGRSRGTLGSGARSS